MELYNAKKGAGGRLAETLTTLGFRVNISQALVPQSGKSEHSINDQNAHCQSQHQTTESLLSAQCIGKIQSFRYCDEQSSALTADLPVVSKESARQAPYEETFLDNQIQADQLREEDVFITDEISASKYPCYVPSYQVPSHGDIPESPVWHNAMHVAENQESSNNLDSTFANLGNLNHDQPDDLSDDTRYYSFRDDIPDRAFMSKECLEGTDGLYEGIDDATLNALIDTSDLNIFSTHGSGKKLATPEQSPNSTPHISPLAVEKIPSPNTINNWNPSTPKISEPTSIEPTRSTYVTQSPGPTRPFLRSQFPPGVHGKSPIQGLSANTMVLRVCFRIGEAYRAGLTQTPKYSKGLATESPLQLIELYAFVEVSYRSGDRHYFRFADLFFPSKPPYLAGIWVSWSDNPVFEQCGRDFLSIGGKEWVYYANDHGKTDQRRMCRVIGTLTTKTELNKSLGYTCFSEISMFSSHSMHEALLINIRSIQTATWDDVAYTKGIVMS